MMRAMWVERLGGAARRVGNTEITMTSVGDTKFMREKMDPGWRWSVDLKPYVGTDLCRAVHQLSVISGRLHVVTEDGSEAELCPGDSAVIPPGHDAWVVGDEPCEIVDFSSTYGHLVAAGEAYNALASSGGTNHPLSRSQAAARLREDVTRGRLDAAAVELVLGAVGIRPRSRGPAGLTRRELEVLVLIATGASAKQVAHALGITIKTATTHIERIYVKCGVSSRSEVTHFAIVNGLVRPLSPDAARAFRLDGPGRLATGSSPRSG